jgi:hypothetical protein
MITAAFSPEQEKWFHDDHPIAGPAVIRVSQCTLKVNVQQPTETVTVSPREVLIPSVIAR